MKARTKMGSSKRLLQFREKEPGKPDPVAQCNPGTMAPLNPRNPAAPLNPRNPAAPLNPDPVTQSKPYTQLDDFQPGEDSD